MKNASTPLAFAIATGFYSGLVPQAPGTAGSIAAVLIWIALSYLGLWSTLTLQIGLVLAIIAVGTWASAEVMKGNKDDSDPQIIVIDEWAGMLITLLAVQQATLLSITLALFWFRLFDVWKPGPVSWAERLPGSFGVMADDCVAGVLAFLMLLACQMGLGNI